MDISGDERVRLEPFRFAGARKAAGLSQTVVAARMVTSASAIARLERGDVNPTMATIQRFAAAIGKSVDWRLDKAK